jgi:hypothetical protein
LGQLQKLATATRFPQAITSSMGIINLVETLHDFAQKYPVNIVVKHYQNIVVSTGGQVSTTKLTSDSHVWRVATAAHCAVWWLQNPTKTFEALTTSLAADH